MVGDAGDERRRLVVTETTAARARERLREAEGRSRAAEVAAMEALLKLETQREQLLVELAGIGPDAVAALAELNAEDRPAETADALAGDLARPSTRPSHAGRRKPDRTPSSLRQPSWRPCGGASTIWAPATPLPRRSTPKPAAGSKRWRRSRVTSRLPSARRAS